MNSDLDELITKYVDVAAELFPRVAQHLGASASISNTDWAMLGVPERGITSDGIKYFKHGYGVVITDGKRKIDLDLGDNGEINGFDAWRLFDFAESNKIPTSFGSHKEIETSIKEAVVSGELTHSGYILYYRV